MRKRNYQKPSMKVVELRHRGMLMTSGVSASQATLQDYGWQTETEE